MVTASHNPPRDNGYKVYLGDGSQIVPPADARDRRPRSPRSARWPTCPRGDGWEILGDDVVDAYLDTDAGLAGDGPARPAARLHADARRRRHVRRDRCSDAPASPRRTSWSSRRSPTRTSRPSPSPTRRSPGAMDLAIAWPPSARRRPRHRQRPGRRPLRRGRARRPRAGGCCAATRSARCSPPTWSTSGRNGTFACSIVSSSLLGKIAAAAGQPYAETLTGFKWIAGSTASVRLRGGARLLRRPRRREGQGRHHGPAPALRAGRPRRRPRSAPWSTSSTTSRWSTGCTPPTSSRSGWTTCR